MKSKAVEFTASLSTTGANAFAARNLLLLNAIENTLDALDSDTQIIAGINASYDELRQKLENTSVVIDADRGIDAKLSKASNSCSRIYLDAQHRYLGARTDPALRPDDGVAEAYKLFIEAVRNLHDTVEDLREWIATHDAVLEPSTSEVFSNVDDLFASLMSGQ